jgi:hypothetical protein
MKKQLVGLVIAGILLTGCFANDSLKMTKPGVSTYQAQRDYDECRYESMKAVPMNYNASMGNLLGQAKARDDIEVQCLKLRGYSPAR